MDDGRLHFPATARNREAIAEVLEPLLPQRGLVLEIASGSGEHLCHFQQQFAASHPLLRWQGSDPDPPPPQPFGRQDPAAPLQPAGLGRCSWACSAMAH